MVHYASTPMNIIFVITNSGGKNLVFVTDTLKIYSLKEAIGLAQNGKLKGTYTVRGRGGIYLRTKPYISKEHELKTISITGKTLLAYAQDARHARSTALMNGYIKRYAASLADGYAYILLPVGQPKMLRVLTAAVKERLIIQKKHVFDAAEEFSIDPAMLGAIIIDEIARLFPFEGIIEALEGNIIGINVSIGVAQVTIDTAHDLIRKGIYHPNPKDTFLPYARLTNAGRRHLYDYLIQPKHNVRFAAAYIRFLIDFWSKHIDLSSRTDIIGTLYHIGYGKPKGNPKADERGAQIANEFYPLAKRWLT